jgi:hypothetical protein
MLLLQRLYERDIPTSGASHDWHRPEDRPPSAAELVHGRMLLTPLGKAKAGCLKGNVPELSDLSFAATVAKAIDTVRSNPEAFRSKLAELANHIHSVNGQQSVSAEDIASPDGEFPDGETLWKNVPLCDNGLLSWREISPAAMDLEALTYRLRTRLDGTRRSRSRQLAPTRA